VSRLPVWFLPGANRRNDEPRDQQHPVRGLGGVFDQVTGSDPSQRERGPGSEVPNLGVRVDDEELHTVLTVQEQRAVLGADGQHFAADPDRLRPRPAVRPCWACHQGADVQQAADTTRNLDDLPRPLPPLVKEGIGRRLVVRRLEAPHGALLILEEQRTAVEPGTLRTFGLTFRETEVATWVVEGKSNPEIATILGMRRHTVAKHLERIYAKLGVEGRAAAMRRLLAPD